MLADRHHLFQPWLLGVEEGQRDLAGVVMRKDPVGDALVAARRRLVAVDAQVERDDRALGGESAMPGRLRRSITVCGSTNSRSPTLTSRSVASAGTTLAIISATFGPMPSSAVIGENRRIEQGRAHQLWAAGCGLSMSITKRW